MATLINFYGGPCAGKSVAAAYLYAKMKQLGLNAELITEEAKDAVWEENDLRLGTQEYLFGMQSLKLARLRGKVDYIITDSPMLMQLYYNTQLPKHKRLPQDAFAELILFVEDQYDVWDIWLERGNWYNACGRSQATEAEATKVAEGIKAELEELFKACDWQFDKELTGDPDKRYTWLDHFAEMFTFKAARNIV